MSIEEYNPANSKISEDTLINFLRSPLTGEITEIPGIGPSQAILLARGDVCDQITNSFQLIGKFLLLKKKDENSELNEFIESNDHCKLFYNYLKNKGIKSHRNDIVMAIAEKTNTMFPGMYDYTFYN
jgi:hypothetical protein